MTEEKNVLKFLLEDPSLPFRVVKRKGELRYIASNQRGSLKALAQFAPPTKRIPKLLLGVFGLFDFQIPRAATNIDISKDFLLQISDRLGITFTGIGIYVGEPNDERKLVVIDVDGLSDFVLKIAVGENAGGQINRELAGIQKAKLDFRWADWVPDAQTVDPVCGRDVIRIDRIDGRQLTPEEFEAAFFAAGTRHWALGIGDISDKGSEKVMTVGEWLDDLNLKSSAECLEPLIDLCRQLGALDLRSQLGVVHGDFAPWNVIRTSESSVKTQVLSVKQAADLKLNHVKPKTVDGLSRRLVAIDWEFSRADTPLIFDLAYATRCYSVLLNRKIGGIEPKLWSQLVALGALWFELRKKL